MSLRIMMTKHNEVILIQSYLLHKNKLIQALSSLGKSRKMMNERDIPHICHRSVLEKSGFSKTGALEHRGRHETLNIEKEKDTKQTRTIVQKDTNKQYILSMISRPPTIWQLPHLA